MPNLDVAIDFGTSFTRVFVAGQGVVLNEPSLIAFDTTKSVKSAFAFGKSARYMLGKTSTGISLVTPVSGGVITDEVRAVILLKEFYNQIFGISGVAKKLNVLVGIPIGLSVDERDKYESVVYEGFKNVKKVTLVENVLLCGVGVGLPIEQTAGGIIVNIGGGVTEVAALSMAGILGGCGLALGGDKFDLEIIDAVEKTRGITMGLASAQKIKHEIASLMPNDVSARPIDGISKENKTITTTLVRASDIFESLEALYSRIAIATDRILNLCPPDAAGDLNKKGVHLVGGSSRITGLPDFMSKKLGIKSFVPAYPEYATIVGAGKLLGNAELLEKVLNRR